MRSQWQRTWCPGLRAVAEPSSRCSLRPPRRAPLPGRRCARGCRCAASAARPAGTGQLSSVVRACVPRACWCWSWPQYQVRLTRRTLNPPPLGRGREHAVRARRACGASTRHHPAPWRCARFAFVRRRPGLLQPAQSVGSPGRERSQRVAAVRRALNLIAGCHWQQVPTLNPWPGGSRLRSSCACPMRHRSPGRSSARSNAQIAALQG